MADPALPTSSKLGTKEHWDAVYAREVRVFEEIGDEGEVWFGEESAEEMVEWVIDEFGVSEGSDHPTILDVGCGNAHLLLLLLEAGYSATTMTGIDYSPASIELSKAICAKHEVEGIEFKVVDVIDEQNELLQAEHRWELITDKGTFDAIALHPAAEEAQIHPADLYPERVASLLTKGGIFLITSCNFTEDELRTRFVNERTRLVYHDHIPRATFEFAGGRGQTVSTVAFRKT